MESHGQPLLEPRTPVHLIVHQIRLASSDWLVSVTAIWGTQMSDSIYCSTLSTRVPYLACIL